MNHLIIPTLSSPEDTERWHFNDNSGSPGGFCFFADGRTIVISDQEKNCQFPDSMNLIVVVNPNSDQLEFCAAQWRCLFSSIKSDSFKWCIWWHAGGSQNLQKSSDEIRAMWTNSISDFEALSALEDFFPFLYSEGAKAGDWDDVIKNEVRDKIVIGKNTSIIKEIIEKLDEAHLQAEAKYHGFSDLKDLLELLFPVYLDLQTMGSLDKHDGEQASEIWKLLQEALSCIKGEQLIESGGETFWLDALYERFVPVEVLEKNSDIPDKAAVQEALDFLKTLKSFKQKPAKAKLETVDLLKRPFQLLNASPDFVSYG